MNMVALKHGFVGACLSAVGMLSAAMSVTENVTLQEDTDWRAQGQVTIAAGVTVDLNGHKLKVAGIDCAGAIVDTGYRELAYIESTGKQWIDTEFVTTDQTAIDFDFTVLSDNGNHAYFCGDWANWGHLFVINGNYINFFGQGTATAGRVGTYTSNTHLRLQTIPGGAKTVVLYNGDTGAELGSSAVVLTHSGSGAMMLFAGRNGNSTAWHASYRLHGFKLTHQGTVVRDLVPTRRNLDGAIGLYDRATQRFFENGGTAPFIAGADTENGAALELDISIGAVYSMSGTCEVPIKVLPSVLDSDIDLRCFGNRLTVDSVYLNGHRLSLASLENVAEVANTIPAYRRLAYIESTGKQWIDTGFLTTADTVIDFDFTVLADNGNHAYFCGDWAGNGHLLVVNGNNINFFGSNSKVGTFSRNTHLRLLTIPGGAKTVVLYNGDTGAELGSADVTLNHTGTGTLMLFAGRNGSSAAWQSSYRLHGLKLTHQGTVVRDLVPVECVADGRGGLYDLVNRRFYPSEGSEDFVKGPKLYEGHGYDSSVATGELRLDVAADAREENATSVIYDNVRFVKAGAGEYVERRVQTNSGGVKLEGGAMELDLDEPTVNGALIFAGGSLVVAEGRPVLATGGASVTAASGIVFRRGPVAGKKMSVVNFGASVPLSQLSLTVTPAIDCEKRLALAGDDLQVVLGGANEVVKAVWSGAEDGDITKPANWYCTNSEDVQMVDGLPTSYTAVTIAGPVALQVPADTGLACGELVLDDCTLTADCDWRGLGVLPIVGTIDLAGHKLYTAGIAGSGTVTSGDVNGYRFYRFKVDATGGKDLQISEIQLFAGDVHITGNRTALHWNATGAYSGYNPDKAFDNNTGTKWYDNRSANDWWVTVEYEKPAFVTRYKWFTSDDTAGYAARNPTAWRLQGSNDNSTWTDLHVVTGQTSPAQNKVEAGVWLVDANQGGDGSELHVEVAADEVQNLSAVTLANRLKLVKDGAGTLVLGKTGQTFGGGIEIAAGYLKPGVRSDGSIFGASCTTITIDDGAQFLDDIFCQGAASDVYWIIAGAGPDGTGAIRTPTRTPSKNNAEVAWGRSLTLAGDAVIGSDEYAFDFVAPNYKTFFVTFGGHELTLKSTMVSGRQFRYFLASSLVGTDAGTLVVGDNLQFFPFQYDAGMLDNVTLVISEQGSYGTEANTGGRDLTVSNLIYRTVSSMSQTNRLTTVLGCYAPVSTTSAPKVQLGDANHLKPRLDVGTLAEAYDVAFGGGLTFFAGSTVYVDVGDRKLEQGELILSWSERPTGVSFKLLNRRGELIMDDEGLRFLSGLMVIVR